MKGKGKEKDDKQAIKKKYHIQTNSYEKLKEKLTFFNESCRTLMNPNNSILKKIVKLIQIVDKPIMKALNCNNLERI